MVANRKHDQLRQPASLRRQAGMGWLGWTAIALMVGVIGLMGLRVVPLYLTYFQILDVSRSLQRESGVAKKSKSELKTIVTQRFRQNNLYDTKPTILKFSKNARQQLIVHIDYEERVNLFFNIDLVVVFDKKLFPN